MKAAYYYGPGELCIEDVPKPRIEEDELLVRLRTTSICGTDLRIYESGHFRIGAGKRVLGHEIAGDIVESGRLLHGLPAGARVCIPPNIGCGLCGYCKNGYNNMCPDYEALGVSIDGGFQQYMRVPSSAIVSGNVFQIPEGMDYEEASLAEPLSTCMNALRSVQTGYEDVVLIIGAGPIGAMHVILSRIAGARKILLANRSGRRLSFVEPFGVTRSINTSEESLREVVMAETNGEGANVVITAASAPELHTEAVQLAATHGRVNFFGGLGGNVEVPIDTNRVHYKGLVLTGSTGSTNADYYRSLQLIAEGRAEVGKLVTRRFPLEEIQDAFDYAASRAGMKTMIVHESSGDDA